MRGEKLYIHLKMTRLFLTLTITFYWTTTLFGQTVSTLTEDGAWCWFSDPRAIYTTKKNGQIVTGWVTKSGDIVAASLDLKTEKIEQKRLYANLEIDAKKKKLGIWSIQ